MRHRLYYLHPDMQSAESAFNEMLLARIDEGHIHFLSKEILLPSHMPEATFFQKTDVMQGALRGMLIGAGLGMLGGIALIMFPVFVVEHEAVLILLSMLCGLLFGGWASSMAAAALPNSRLESYFKELDEGKVLMILDVPSQRVKEVETLLAERHPEMRFGGEDTHIPVFP